MSGRIKKTMAGVAAVVLAFTMVVAAIAGSTDARFTFTNVQETQPDLYVIKTVSSALDGYSNPDTDFTFILKWDRDGDGYLEFAENAKYFVYDSTGKQVMNEDTSDGSYKTGSTGRFTLKDGQYAYFEWAGTVRYEITEETADGYMQIVPAGGEVASGTIPAEGAVVNFENVYVPETDGEETMLAVRKDISWPDGYEIPESIDANFTFSISIDGEIYRDEPYTVYNWDMSEELDKGRTDSSGCLTIGYGRIALFEGIETGVDYEIEETDNPDGWRTVGTTEYHGSTVSPIIYAYFTNEGTAFIASKERTDGIADLDDSYEFTLTGSSGSPMSGVSYYTYDEKGSLTGSGATDEDGHFQLKAGESAIFVGIAEGSGYSIVESVPEGYASETEDGFSGEINYNNAESYTFVNEQLSNITIRKSEANREDNLLGGAQFTIYRLKDGGDPDNEDDYERYGEPLTTESDEASELFGTLTFTNLPEGTYMIKETEAPEGYMITGSPIYVTLPYTMMNEEVSKDHLDTESDEFNGLYSRAKNTYYFYDLTYDVTDRHSILSLPSAGGNGWMGIVGLAVCAAGAGAYMYYCRHRRNSSENNNDNEGGKSNEEAKKDA